MHYHSRLCKINLRGFLLIARYGTEFKEHRITGETPWTRMCQKSGNSRHNKWNELLQQDLIRLPHWIELTLSVFFIQFYDIPSPVVVRAVILKPRGTRFSSRDGLTCQCLLCLRRPIYETDTRAIHNTPCYCIYQWKHIRQAQTVHYRGYSQYKCVNLYRCFATKTSLDVRLRANMPYI